MPTEVLNYERRITKLAASFLYENGYKLFKIQMPDVILPKNDKDQSILIMNPFINDEY